MIRKLWLLFAVVQGALSHRKVGYFTNWGIYKRDFQPQDVPVAELTHVLYAFANVMSTGEVVLSDVYADAQKLYSPDTSDAAGTNLHGCMEQFYLLKQRNPHLRVSLSIGGWTYSPNIAAALSTEGGVSTFAASALQFLKDLPIDGLDIDWEYAVTDQQSQDFLDLIRTMRSMMDDYSASLPDKPHFELTVAAPVDPVKSRILQLRAMDQYLDFWNLMAYDYSGSFSDVAGHQANLYPSVMDEASTPFDTNDAVEYYVRQGIPASKIVLGMPLYGRSFESTRGPGQSFSGVGPGSFEPGVWDYKALPRSGSVVIENMTIAASWSYDTASEELISYDTVAIAKAKARFIKERELGGAMWWELSGDRQVADDQSLIRAVCGELDDDVRQSNILSYPNSKYPNIRKDNGSK